MENNNYYFHQKVDWNKFMNAVTFIGMFIVTISIVIEIITLFVSSADLFFFAACVFGLILMIEGMIASLFNVGDK